MDMDELGFFIFMEEQERKEKEQQEGDIYVIILDAS